MRKACARGIKDIFDCAPFDPESSRDGSNAQPTEFLSLLQDPDDPWVRSYVPSRLPFSHTLSSMLSFYACPHSRQRTFLVVEARNKFWGCGVLHLVPHTDIQFCLHCRFMARALRGLVARLNEEQQTDVVKYLGGCSWGEDKVTAPPCLSSESLRAADFVLVTWAAGRPGDGEWVVRDAC